jgi:SAM-dependent methyltransferase
MEGLRQLLACPACEAPLAHGGACTACAQRYEDSAGVMRLRLHGDARTDVVREFYEKAPFPGYPPNDSLTWLRARAERSRFARMLDAAIPGDAKIVEVGCGTGQMSLYLARADRLVVGADLALPSLELAASAARRFAASRVQFVETDLHQPGLKKGAFDVVYSSGVLHHTPDPGRAFANIVPLARPGGMVVVGLYNSFARIPLRLRRAAARLTGFRWIPADPVLRDRRNEPARREAWLRDQYLHPEEHRHSHAEVLKWFEENGVDYVRAFPSALLEEDSDDLFEPAPDRWRLEGWLAQLGWIGSIGHEGGLFVMVGRRRPEVTSSQPEVVDLAEARRAQRRPQLHEETLG